MDNCKVALSSTLFEVRRLDVDETYFSNCLRDKSYTFRFPKEVLSWAFGF